MSVTIFWRIILGSLTILFLSVGVSSFSIVQLGGFSRDASTILNKDHRMMAYEEKLTEAFLSEVRYAGKFIITQATTHYDQAKQFRKDFLRYMEAIVKLASLPDIKSRLGRIREFHDRYVDLYDQEVRYLKNGQSYAQSRYRQEKETNLDSSLKELEHLKGQLQQNLHAKLERMEQGGRTARTIATVTTLILLVLGIALSFVISRSITTPLLKLTQRMVEDNHAGKGVIVQFTEIPEIEKLSEALNNAKDRVRQATETNTRFVNSITDEIVMPLVSLQQRLGYLQKELTQVLSPEQATALDVLTHETEHLIQHCTQLRLPPEMEADALSRQIQKADNQTPARPRTAFSFSYESKYLPRAKLRVASFVTRGAPLATGFWHSIRDSLRTLTHGKARK